MASASGLQREVLKPRMGDRAVEDRKACRVATGAAGPAPVAKGVVPQPAAFAALGVGCAVGAKSALLLSVSWPSGRRMALEPGAAVVGGAAVGCPSPRPFAAVPYATASVSVPVAVFTPRLPPVAAIDVPND